MKVEQHRQGDILLVPAQLPAGAQPVAPSPRGVVLAEGEATGHAHVMDAATVKMWSAGEQRYVEVLAPTPLTHEEHGGSVVAPGVYEVLRKHEYTDEDEWRTIAD